MSEISQKVSKRRFGWLGARPDETILRGVFFGLVGITLLVFGLDAYERSLVQPPAPSTNAPFQMPDAETNLPSARPDMEPAANPMDGDELQALQRPMTFELMPDGRLEATGTITPGSAERFAQELEKRGTYARTVVLNSPGGSVSDAIAMARLIREKGLATRVEANAHCASSCPLVFAGGDDRVASKTASIGVHQVFAAMNNEAAIGSSLPDGMAAAQRVTAQCQRLLSDMGVDLRVWIHAMDTPPQQLFYFTPDELSELKLATRIEA